MNAGQFKPQNAVTRFMARVSPSDGCWQWIGAINPNKARRNYPLAMFYLDGKNQKASRAAWLLLRGPIPEAMHVCHTCDNPLCVNPDHLFLGTHRDNMHDCAVKGRVGTAKLNPDRVRQIRLLRRNGMSMQAIADRFEVSERAVEFVLKGVTWSYVKDAALSALDKE
jgi:hypothetical protein